MDKLAGDVMDTAMADNFHLPTDPSHDTMEVIHADVENTSKNPTRVTSLMQKAFKNAAPENIAKAHEIQTQFSKPKVLMEVLTSSQSKMVLAVMYLVGLLAFLQNMVLLILDFTILERVGGPSDNPVHYTADPIALIIYELVIGCIMTGLLIAMAVLYTAHYHRRTTESTFEQKWMGVLLIASVFLVFPVRSIVDLVEKKALKNTLVDDALSGSVPGSFLTTLIYGFITFSAIVATVVAYILITLRGYSFSHSEKLPVSFVASIAYYGIFFILFRILIYVCYKIILGSIMFVPLIIAIRLEAALDGTPGLPPVTWIAVAIDFSLEIFIVFWVSYEVKRTRKLLKAQNYLKTRSKQIGFEFFVHQLDFTFAVLLATTFAFTASRPLGLIAMMVQRVGTQFIVVDSEDLATRTLITSFTLIQAYLHLPADISGLFSFSHGAKRDAEIQQRLNSFKLRTIDPRDEKGSLILNPRTFALETQVLMLNCSYTAYKLFNDEFAEEKDFSHWGDEDHRIVKKYVESNYDTHAVLIESDERIIIAFRGTASSKNMQSDIDFLSVKLSSFFEHDTFCIFFERNHEKGTQEISKLLWKSARVHNGFSTSHKAVRDEIEADVMHLYTQKKRIVYVCGHSLGGALGTLFAFGLLLRHPYIYESGLLLTTFGSPRVGNISFHHIFNYVVHNCWRVVNSGDVVTKIPPGKYHHVGTQVLLTMNSEMFIDPCYLEFKWWHKNVTKAVTHRVQAYYMSLRSYVESYIGEDKLSNIGFWDWKLSSGVKRMYDHNMHKKCSLLLGRNRGPTSKGVILWRDLVTKILAKEAGIEL